MGRTTQQEDRLKDVIIEYNDVSRTNEPSGGNAMLAPWAAKNAAEKPIRWLRRTNACDVRMSD